MSKFFINFNANKWGKNHGDCAIRSLVVGTGMDYEAVCKKLDVECVPNEGFTGNGDETSGIDLEYIQKKFSTYLGDIQDYLLSNPDVDPVEMMLNSKSLVEWFEDGDYGEDGRYLVYLDDNKENDGGHIVYAYCSDSKKYYYDTTNCDDMPVQAWIKIKKVVPKSSKLHYKYDKDSKKFL